MVNSPANYAGDLTVEEAWSLLGQDPSAQLVDVRTSAEWNYVGVADLAAAGRTPHFIEWQTFPSGSVDPGFAEKTVEALKEAGAAKDTPVLFLCRSGARSRSAAIALTQAGYTRAYNIAGGFEGDLDASGHRSSRNGWRHAGLPWRQY
ncbi:MAG TPA: rhodanese-like domain-containing protein [Rhizomicrobium sp.]|jgi:rhodanese-related sulfurtransferase